MNVSGRIVTHFPLDGPACVAFPAVPRRSLVCISPHRTKTSLSCCIAVHSETKISSLNTVKVTVRVVTVLLTEYHAMKA